jgi:hypothetical protein
MKKLFFVAERSWQGKAGLGLMMYPRFFETFSKEAARRDWLLLSVLESNGVPMAFQYDLRYSDCIYSLMAGFDPSQGRLSPGLVLRAVTLQKALEEGYHKFNFLAGDHPWKREWTDSKLAHRDLYIFNHTPGAWVFRKMRFGLRPWIKRVKLTDVFERRRTGASCHQSAIRNREAL